MKNSIVGELHQIYKEGQNNKELQELYNLLVTTVKGWVEDRNVKSKILDTANNIESISSELSFEAGFKCAIQLMKECGLL